MDLAAGRELTAGTALNAGTELTGGLLLLTPAVPASKGGFDTGDDTASQSPPSLFAALRSLKGLAERAAAFLAVGGLAAPTFGGGRLALTARPFLALGINSSSSS
jgi:hypothetical protein